MLLKPDRVDSDELLEELETASNKERFSYVGILPCSAEMENCVMRGNRMVVNYLKALPSVMAWIFLSSATMSSISCNSYMGPRGQISRKLFCCHLFHCVSFPSQPLQHLLSFFYSSNLYQPPGKFIKESFNQRFETTYHWLIVSLPW